MNKFQKVILQEIGQETKIHIKQKDYFDIPILSTSIMEQVTAMVMTMFFSEVAASYITASCAIIHLPHIYL